MTKAMTKDHGSVPWARRYRERGLLLGLVLLASCGRGEATDSGAAEASVLALSAADVATVALTVTGPEITRPIQVAMYFDHGHWSALVGKIPAGTHREFAVVARDVSGAALYQGAATGVTVVAGQTVTVLITAQQVTPPTPFQNAAPVIDSLVVAGRQVAPGEAVGVKIVAHDPNPGDTLTLAWTATGGTFAQPSATTTTWNAPATEGSYELSIRVTDDRGGAAAATVTVQVSATNGRGQAAVSVSVNSAPTVNNVSAANGAFVAGQPVALVADIADPDGDVLSFAWTTPCAGTFSAPTALTTSFTLAASESAATCTLTVTANDGRGGINTGALALAVGAPTANAAPVIVSTVQSAGSVAQNQTVTLAVVAEDPEGKALSFAWATDAGTVTAADSSNGSTATFTMPAPADNVTATITVTVTDADGAATMQTFVVTGISSVLTIAFLPDTQIYSEDPEVTPAFAAQINWLMANRTAKNIVFVAHEGDVVDNGRDSGQWSRAMASLAPLISPANTVLPFSINRGNHDDADYFRANLPASIYQGRPWAARVSPNGLDNAEIFQAAGRSFAHLGINKDPTAEDIAWVNGVLDSPEFASLPTIVTTHDYLISGGLSPTGGDLLWQPVIKNHPMIFMVCNGHTHTEYQMVSHNAANRPVYQMLADYQDRADGGQGLMRLVTVDIPNGTIAVKTFSPGYTTAAATPKVVASFFETDADSDFTYTTNLVERFNPSTTYDFGPEPPKPAPPALGDIVESAGVPAHYTHVFQQRRGGYAGTMDTQLNENNAWLDYAGESTVTTDLDDSGSRVQSMLMFHDIIGAGVGQIPPGATITKARLFFTVTSSSKGNVSVHRMLIPWHENSRWIDFTPVDPVSKLPTMVSETFYDPSTKTNVTHTIMQDGGISADDVEAVSTFDAKFTCPKPIPVPFFKVDVTASVQAWVNGQTNHGWVFRNDSTDGWDFYTAEGQQPPALVVEVAGAPYIN